jgi:GTP-binding protein EngB required for normal cell division
MRDEKPMSAGRRAQRPRRRSGETMSNGDTHSHATPADAGDRLRGCDRLKLDLASLIQSALRLINERTDPEIHRRCRELLASLAEDRFTLAVVGQFNRGKSSLMNALLGLDRLPVGVVPLTSVITKVSYGNPERVLIEFQRTSLKDEVPLEQLAEFVTETGNPGNRKRILAVDVQLPSEFLRRGLFFVDTPGIGSAMIENTVTTEQFLPQADAVIFVTSFESPLGREELEFLGKVREHVRKAFFVVNKLDLVAPEQRDQVLAFIRQRLEQETGLRAPRIFAVSALVGLEAKLSGSSSRLAESGLPAIEENVIQFLTTEKAREFLVRTCDRAVSILGEITQVAVEMGRPGGAWVGTYDQFMANEAGHDPQAIKGGRHGAIEDIFDRVRRLREELLGNSGEKRPLVAARLTIKSRPEAEIMEAVRRPCQVCARVADAIMKFMAKYQYQIIISENERAALAGRGGLCPLHTWQYAEIASPQGISTSYPDVLTELSGRLADIARSQAPGSFAEHTKGLLARGDKCRACLEQSSHEEQMVNEILKRITTQNDEESANLPVLCLVHLSAVLGKVRDDNLARSLVDFEAAIFERLAENMERSALKHDSLRRGLQSDDERIAYHRGLSQLAGDKRLQAPWRVEYLL